MNRLFLTVVLMLGAVCDPVPEVNPSFTYDEARCEGYRIVSAPARWLDKKMVVMAI